MKRIFRKIISLILVLCTVFTTGLLTSVAVSAASLRFESDNSYLTYDEYLSLNLYVGSANVNTGITDCYDNVSIKSIGTTGYAGGIAGFNFGTINNSFYNIDRFKGDAVGKAVVPAGENVYGKTTAEFNV